jgi:DNA-binding CsgD family transcriptional regulator
MQRLSQLLDLIESTADAAFVTEVGIGIVGWNKAAADLLGISAAAVIGKPCWRVVQSIDECGPLCSEDCIVMQAAGKHRAIANFDAQLTNAPGKPWCNVYIMYAEGERSKTHYIVHLLRNVDLRKRLELALRDFVVQKTHLSTEDMKSLFSATRTPATAIQLTNREQEIVRFLASGKTSRQIADQLNISYTTVNNHIQNLMKKLSAKNRLEAIRRAERAGLI